MKTKCCFIIPFFSNNVPDYFDLWAQSAGMNNEIDFLIFSNLDFNVEKYKNIKVIKMDFKEVQQLIKEKLESLLNMKIKINAPYKLCDYRPAYGLVFNEYIQGYDFWGFCDIDVILGKISSFINDELFENYDKLFFHGHFSLIKNNEKMNMIFMKKYPKVMDYEFSFTTNYPCHFDENGTLAFISKYEEDIRVYFKWVFIDVDYESYQTKHYWHGSDSCYIWENGRLTYYWDNAQKSEEIMYVHLQKRAMRRNFPDERLRFAIYRDEFIGLENESAGDILALPLDEAKEADFYKRRKKKRREGYINAIKKGAIKNKIYRKKNHILKDVDMNAFN